MALRTSSLPEEYLRAATDVAAIDIWAAVVRDYPAMKFWVAHNKTVPLEILVLLASDSDPKVRWAVAMKNKLSRDVMLLLSEDPDDAVRARIACNKNADREILYKLAVDSSTIVAAAAKSRL